MRLKIPNQEVRDFLMRSCYCVVKKVVSRINVRDAIREVFNHSVDVYAYRNYRRYSKESIEDAASLTLNVSEKDKPEYKEKPCVRSWIGLKGIFETKRQYR